MEKPASIDFRSLFSREKKFIGVKLLLIFIVLPVTVFLAMQEQDTRQRASEVAAEPCALPAAAAAEELIAKGRRKAERVPGRIIVKYKTDSAVAAAESSTERRLQRYQARQLQRIERIRTQIIEVKKGEEEKALQEIRSDANVAYAEPDYVGHAAEFIPNDPSFSKQYGLKNSGQNGGTVGADIKATLAWDTTRGTKSGEKIRVAVLDTGIDQNHPDISSKIILNKNFSPTSSVDDFYGHGTHVAGIIAATTHNGSGVAGVCPDCVLLNGKVLDDSGNGVYSTFAQGIIWAADNGAKVINMSLAGPNPSQTLTDAVNYATSKGALVVAAAGNGNQTNPVYPAAIANAIAVGATDNKDQRSTFSNYNATWIDVAAPGTGIYSTAPNHPYKQQTVLNYTTQSGTSMATPHVAGVAALLFATSYGTSPQSVRDRIERTAKVIPGTESYWKYGKVHAANAVAGGTTTPTATRAPIPTATYTPVPTATATANPSPTPTPCPPTATPTTGTAPTQPESPVVTDTPTPTPPGPTNTPTQIPTPTIDPLATKFSLTVFIQGIGRGGDNVSPNSEGNMDPIRKQRGVEVILTDLNEKPVTTAQGLLNFSEPAGNFIGTIAVPNLPSGSYLIKVSTESTLRQMATSVQKVTKGGTITVAPLTLIAGDINDDNALNILDYNIVASTYTQCKDEGCSQAELSSADLNDDGKVDGIDYNLLLRNFSVQAGR